MTLSEVRHSLSSEDIIKILSKYNVSPVVNTENYIIFPTCCHNLYGGSPKLYYYKDSHLFKCFTQCEGVFDIFELIMKMEALRGNNSISFNEILLIIGVNPKEITNNLSDDQKTIDYLYEFTKSVYKINDLQEIDNLVLNASIFNKEVLSIWEKEGISFKTMQKYKIGYDPIANCITIPIYDHNGQLVSVRGRFLSEEEKVKYKPITFCNKILSVPSSQVLYGLFQNKKTIEESQTAIIFESEKSVLMMDTCYGANNSVATLGKNISNQHILLLKKFKVEEVILAYDADYKNEQEFKNKYKEYIKIAKTLAPFFSVSVIMDWNNKLPYKASPIDCGKNIFESLLENKHYVKF